MPALFTKCNAAPDWAESLAGASLMDSLDRPFAETEEGGKLENKLPELDLVPSHYKDLSYPA